MKNLIGAICVSGVLLGAVSCNMLSQDPDVKKPVTVNKEINVSETGATVIDLKSKIQIAGGASLTISRQPRKGSLKSLGQGMLQYTPSQLNVKTRDNFEFTIYDLNSQVVDRDSVVIIVGGDSSSCFNFTRDDYAYLAEPNAWIPISAVGNDFFCSIDSSKILLTIVSDSFPAHGTASVAANRYIIYTGVNNTSLEDLVIYKVQSTTNPSDVMYGVVHIIPPPSCTTALHDDYYHFNYDSITPGDTLRMDFLNNDVICNTTGSFPDNIIILSDFKNGVSRLRSTLGGILSYIPDPMASGTTRQDSLIYEICYSGNCAMAKVKVELTKP